MILKIKAFIYKLTGIYLAHKEQCKYMESKEFWESFAKVKASPFNEISNYTASGILIGSWQAKHGFARKMRF